MPLVRKRSDRANILIVDVPNRFARADRIEKMDVSADQTGRMRAGERLDRHAVDATAGNLRLFTFANKDFPVGQLRSRQSNRS